MPRILENANRLSGFFPKKAETTEQGRAASLAGHFEDLLCEVWRLEKEWALDDRLTFAVRADAARQRARLNKAGRRVSR